MSEEENPLEVVDISTIDIETADKLIHAASTQGFLMIEGHNFKQAEIDNLFEISANFFKQSSEEKLKYSIGTDNCGYTNFGSENLDQDNPNKPKGDPKEGFNFAQLDLTTGIPNQELPDYFKDPIIFNQITKTILKLQENIYKILKLLAIGLKIDLKEGGENFFIDRHKAYQKSGSAFRMLHYPSSKSLNPEESIRAGAHTDYGGLTLLFQEGKDQSKGLEIFSPILKKWQAVPYVAPSPKYQQQGYGGPLVVNIADALSYWTNGYLKSTIHRVKFPKDFQESGKSRYSIVYFSHPENSTPLTPVPSELIRSIKGRGASYEYAKNGTAITALEHLTKRLDATYYQFRK
ncbi:hypothetical protein PACTADRAFT_47863 [Pachysolen tannophilus NRRL Y-2460]|uniref:Fe2OG dioxygenase domain-containing protein n=1 Tax=Pachysolen tannophilus NRRL Y-2460 TaxID=669874 RepID=A0A1E4U215_PACTA|nr:hypothetical protein PACTADRAFT_47863 [Pachysolen tannophilus NRRL Y-2460]